MFEIRNSKTKAKPYVGEMVSRFDIWIYDFEFVSDFVLRNLRTVRKFEPLVS